MISPPSLIGSFMHSVNEMTPINVNILTVSAIDLDSSLSYSIFNISNENFPFNIDSDTGDISLTSPLDYELVNSYTFYIKAEDGINSDVQKYVFNVIDENDNAPSFKPNIANVSIFENATTGSFVTNVTANDLDTGGFWSYILQVPRVRFPKGLSLQY